MWHLFGEGFGENLIPGANACLGIELDIQSNGSCDRSKRVNDKKKGALRHKKERRNKIREAMYVNKKKNEKEKNASHGQKETCMADLSIRYAVIGSRLAG